MKLEKIRLRDIVDEKLTNEELELLKGGFYTLGCSKQVCKDKIDNYTQYCTNGDPICSTGLA
jgi:hypothetical protein